MISGPDLGTFSRPSTWMRVTHFEMTRESSAAPRCSSDRPCSATGCLLDDACHPLDTFFKRVVVRVNHSGAIGDAQRRCLARAVDRIAPAQRAFDALQGRRVVQFAALLRPPA